MSENESATEKGIDWGAKIHGGIDMAETLLHRGVATAGSLEHALGAGAATLSGTVGKILMGGSAALAPLGVASGVNHAIHGKTDRDRLAGGMEAGGSAASIVPGVGSAIAGGTAIATNLAKPVLDKGDEVIDERTGGNMISNAATAVDRGTQNLVGRIPVIGKNETVKNIAGTVAGGYTSLYGSMASAGPTLAAGLYGMGRDAIKGIGSLFGGGEKKE